MDKIILTNMRFFGFHGLLPEEKKLGQRFNVDVELHVDTQKAGLSDAMEDSIDYSKVFEHVKKIVEGPSKNLIEAVAESVASNLLASFSLLEACKVKVIKPDPPIPGHYESVAVEIFREEYMIKAYIALGTNIEPRVNHLQEAIKLVETNQSIELIRKSSIYETPPVGYIDQADFLNMVIEVDTSLTSDELLAICQLIEKELGRKRLIRYGPRTIDLDILVYNQENKQTEQLIIPHPRMHERGFVLIPLNEIAPNLLVPSFNRTVSELLNELPEIEKKGIYRWNQAESEEE